MGTFFIPHCQKLHPELPAHAFVPKNRYGGDKSSPELSRVVVTSAFMTRVTGSPPSCHFEGCLRAQLRLAFQLCVHWLPVRSLPLPLQLQAALDRCCWRWSVRSLRAGPPLFEKAQPSRQTRCRGSAWLAQPSHRLSGHRCRSPCHHQQLTLMRLQQPRQSPAHSWQCFCHTSQPRGGIQLLTAERWQVPHHSCGKVLWRELVHAVGSWEERQGESMVDCTRQVPPLHRCGYKYR